MGEGDIGMGMGASIAEWYEMIQTPCVFRDFAMANMTYPVVADGDIAVAKAFPMACATFQRLSKIVAHAMFFLVRSAVGFAGEAYGGHMT